MQQKVVQHGRDAFHERGMAEDKRCMRRQPHQRVDSVSTQDVVEASQHARVSKIADVLIAFLGRQVSPGAGFPEKVDKFNGIPNHPAYMHIKIKIQVSNSAMYSGKVPRQCKQNHM